MEEPLGDDAEAISSAPRAVRGGALREVLTALTASVDSSEVVSQERLSPARTALGRNALPPEPLEDEESPESGCPAALRPHELARRFGRV